MTTFLLNVFGVCVAQILGVIVSEAVELQVGHEEACLHEHVATRVLVGLPPKWLVPPDPLSSFSSKNHHFGHSHYFGPKPYVWDDIHSSFWEYNDSLGLGTPLLSYHCTWILHHFAIIDPAQLRYVPTLIFYESVSEAPALLQSIEELTRQVDALPDQSCAVM